MEITNNTIVSVYNYMPIKIIASTNTEDYIFEPCQTNTPVSLPMSMSDVKEIHSKSRIFADGWLVFDEEEKDDIYQFLKIKDGDKILNQEEIMNCLISGGKEDVEKLINIKSKGYFERVYGVYIALKQSNMYDISMRVAKAIEYRYKELQQGIINTKIELSNSFKADNKDRMIEEQQALLQEQEKQMKETNNIIEELKNQIAALQLQVSNTKNNQPETTDGKQTKTTSSAPVKKGRPAKSTK